MTATVKHIVEEALRLAPEERGELVETLLSHQEPDDTTRYETSKNHH